VETRIMKTCLGSIGKLSLAVSAIIAAMLVAHAQAPTAQAQLPKTFMGRDCARVAALGKRHPLNLGFGRVRIGCGLTAGGSATSQQASAAPPPSPGNIDVITGTETYPHVTQSESMIATNGSIVVVNYNDSQNDANDQYSGVSVSTNGGATFTRLLPAPFATGHGDNFGDPLVVYNAKLGKFFAGDIVGIYLDRRRRDVLQPHHHGPAVRGSRRPAVRHLYPGLQSDLADRRMGTAGSWSQSRCALCL
jgi:hypothetical protein